MKPLTTIYAGLDVGGSNTRMAVRADASPAIRHSAGPGMNIMQIGIEQAIVQLHQTIHDGLGPRSETSKIIIHAGIAGAGRPADKVALQQDLERALADLGEIDLTIVTDAELALVAAHGEQSGVLCIVGTGSILMAMTQQHVVVRAGGWGRLMGDEAGGFRIGQAALAAVADAMDGGPATQLVAQLTSAYNITSPDALIAFAYDPQTKLQHIAPLVLDAAAQADPIALQIVDEQLALLADRLTWLYQRHPDIEQRTSFVGGLVQNAWFKQRLGKAIMDRLPAMSIVEPAMAPVDAALRCAMARS